MSKSIENKPLFTGGKKYEKGFGYHNLPDVLSSASDEVLDVIQHQYGARCGHVPLTDVKESMVMVRRHDQRADRHFDYLTDIYGKKITPKTGDEIADEISRHPERSIIGVPYINHPDTENLIRSMNAEVWGLPSKMVKQLKNKADFHSLITSAEIKGLHVPDYRIVNVNNMVEGSEEFLRSKVSGLYEKYNMDSYQRGIMVRAAESDGNYGAGIIRQENGYKVFYPDGRRENAKKFVHWGDAFRACQSYIRGTIDPEKEQRVVISRYMDVLDSPGMSVAIMEGKVVSLGWNGQLQRGTACVGTSAYEPKDDYSRFMRETQEHATAEGFKKLLRHSAAKMNVDFDKISGFANIDLMIPGEKERELQQKRYGEARLYLAESNPRITNWTDAVQTGVAADRLPQTIVSMKRVIANGIKAEDKYEMPESVDPEKLRDEVYRIDAQLKEQSGTRIIVRMPVRRTMGVIFMGNTDHARRLLTNKVEQLVENE